MIWIFLWMKWIFTEFTLLFTFWCTYLLHHQKCKKNWFASHGTNDTKFNFRNSPRFYNQNAFYLIINFHILSLHKLFPWLYHIMYMLWIALYSIHCKWYFTNSKGFIHVVSCNTILCFLTVKKLKWIVFNIYEIRINHSEKYSSKLNIYPWE